MPRRHPEDTDRSVAPRRCRGNRQEKCLVVTRGDRSRTTDSPRSILPDPAPSDARARLKSFCCGDDTVPSGGVVGIANAAMRVHSPHFARACGKIQMNLIINRANENNKV